MLPYLQMAIESVRQSNPEGRIYVMAEDCDPIEGVNWWPCNYGTPLMLANLQAQCEFLISSRNERGATAFLDVDTLVRKELVGIPNADLVVTYRKHIGEHDGQKIEGVAKYMPHNYGVVLAGDSVGAKEAFIWMRERVSRYHRQLKNWYGNQRALAELAGNAPESPCTRTRSLQGRDIEVAYLDCDTWNYSPEKDGEDVSGKYIVHLKGGRKDLMEHYSHRGVSAAA